MRGDPGTDGMAQWWKHLPSTLLALRALCPGEKDSYFTLTLWELPIYSA